MVRDKNKIASMAIDWLESSETIRTDCLKNGQKKQDSIV
jgi:hypothetical protein